MSEASPRELTSQILNTGQRDGRTLDQLVPMVYTELRRLAERYAAREQPNALLQPTALVHDVYLKLVDESVTGARGRGFFFGAAARAMRQILVDNARTRRTLKAGGGWNRVSLHPDLKIGEESEFDMLDLDEALQELAGLDERQAKVVELRYFGGLEEQETADVLGFTTRTIRNDWQVARAWLRQKLGG